MKANRKTPACTMRPPPARAAGQPLSAKQPDTSALYEGRLLKAIAARWDAKARTWDHDLEDPACHLNEDNAYHRFLAEADRLVETRRDFCAGQGVIDAGCGTGLVLARVVSAFAWGIGVDISPEMIRCARAKEIAGARFKVEDCFRLATACPKAGAIFSRGVLLSHYGRRQGVALLEACAAALVPGGFLLADFLNEGGRGRHSHQPKNKTCFTSKQVCAMARSAGFRTAMVLGGAARRVLLLLAEHD